MKKIILLLSCLSLSILINAQHITIKKSTIIKESKRNASLTFSKPDGNGGLITVKSIFSGISNKIKAYKIDHYNADLKLIKSVTLSNEKNTNIESVFVKDDEVHLIKFQTAVTKDVLVYVHSSSVESLNFTSKKLLYTFDKEKRNLYFSSLKRDKDANGMIAFSKNKKYFVLSFDVKNKEKEMHLFLVYDSNFHKVYQTTFTSDIKDKYFDFEDIDIDDDNGTIYLLGKVFVNKRLRSKKKTNYHFELYKITEDKQEHLNVKETTNFIGSLYLLHNKNKLNLVGFYSNKNDFRYKGVCMYSLSEDLKIINKSFKPFSNQFFEDKYRLGAKTSKRKKKLKNLSFRSVFLDVDGNIIINAEEYYITVNNQFGGINNQNRINNQFGINNQFAGVDNQFNSRPIYHFDDIISVKIGADGKLLWARNINKKQVGRSNSSFTAIVVEGENYLFINASDKIKKLSNNRIAFKPKSAKRSNLYVIKIDKVGEVSYKKLIDDKDSKVWYRVNNGKLNYEDNSIIFQGVRKKHQRIIKLTVN